MALSYCFIQKMVQNIAPIVVQQRIEKMGQFSSTDFFFTLSKNRDQALFISLNPSAPFVGLFPKNQLSHQVVTPFFQSLRKELDHAFIHDMKLLDDNRIIQMHISMTSPTYQTLEKDIFIELIPQQANFLLVDETQKISLLFQSKPLLTSKRPLLRNMLYLPPELHETFSRYSKEEALLLESNPPLSEHLSTPVLYLVNDKPSVFPGASQLTRSITVQDIVMNYLSHSDAQRKKQLYAPMFTVIKRRIKILEKKLIELDIDRQDALSRHDDLKKGDLLITYADKVGHQSQVIFDDVTIDIDAQLSVVAQANRYYKSYRKAKQALSHIDEQKILATSELEYLKSIQLHLENSNMDEAKIIESELMENGLLKSVPSSKKPIHPMAKSPYIFEVDGIKIGYGHNHLQNDYLTFSLAKPNHHFIHTLHSPGAHVVIFDDNPSEKVILIAASVALKLSHLTTGEVSLCKRKDVKKNKKPGQVILDHFQTLRLVHLDPQIETYIQKAVRA